MPCDQRAGCRCVTGEVELAGQARSRANVVTVVPGLEQIEKPQSLLRERERPGSGVCAAGDHWVADLAACDFEIARERPATVGSSKKSRSLTSTSKASRTRARTRAAIRECPPSSKKFASSVMSAIFSD